MLTSKPDPLYLIFEKHLNESQDGYFDKPTFIETVLKDYLSHLKKYAISVPSELEPFVHEELKQQINLMLLKKTYGFLTTQQYHQSKKNQRNRG